MSGYCVVRFRTLWMMGVCCLTQKYSRVNLVDVVTSMIVWEVELGPL